MLIKEIQTLTNLDLTRTRDPEKLVFILSVICNTIKDIMTLAVKHGIEDNLYYADSLQRIYQYLGDDRLTNFLTSVADDDPSEKEKN